MASWPPRCQGSLRNGVFTQALCSPEQNQGPTHQESGRGWTELPAAQSPAPGQPATRGRVMCVGKHSMKSNDKTKTDQGQICPRQRGHADLGEKRMFRQDMVLQGKCKNIKVLVYNPAEVAILSIYHPPDKAGTRAAPPEALLLGV